MPGAQSGGPPPTQSARNRAGGSGQAPRWRCARERAWTPGLYWHGALPDGRPSGWRRCRGCPAERIARGVFSCRGFVLRPHRENSRAWSAVTATGSSGSGDEAQGGHISAEARINERIRAPEVRLVGPKGEQIGIVSINDALKLAQEADLDLVEVAPTARPPVAKLMDYGKFKYESAVKARESRKNQTQTVVKEIKLRPKIDPHDYGTKKGHVERFLKAGDKVKVTIMFRGREQSRPELGFRLLQRLASDVEELGFVESQPKQDGRNMIMVIGPHRKKSETKAHTAGQA
ncbi:MAG TPA: translation initiation factor IF-3, partial [Streptosporangiaceae bacterium]|nr:translation initiation factor IF-3 [Streptosporangiaceae bacterium]